MNSVLNKNESSLWSKKNENSLLMKMHFDLSKNESALKSLNKYKMAYTKQKQSKKTIKNLKIKKCFGLAS